MPTLHLHLCPPQEPARLRALAQALTQLSTTVLGKRAAVTALHIQQADAPLWALGGESPKAPMAMLEIRISQGSNTDEEKAAFVAQAYAALQTHLGGSSPLAEASYVTVLEVPAQNWGYGGLTQAQRKVMSAG